MDTPEQKEENKKALKVFGVESLIILILIFVIIGILSFLNIIPLRSLIPGLPGVNPTSTPKPGSQGYFDPGRAAVLSMTPAQPTIIENTPANVTASSLNPNYTLTLSNEDEFVSSVLDQLPLFGRVYPSADPNVKSTINSLNIILANEPSETYILTDDQGVYSSADIKIQGNTVIIRQYWAPRVFEKYGSDASFVFQGSVLFNLYNFLYLGNNSENIQNANENVKKINDAIKESGVNYLTITGK